MNVRSLSPDNVKSLVADALRMDDSLRDSESVTDLASTIHKKTDGVPFYVIEFLQSLFDDKLLQYNYGLMGWIWDEDDVKEKLVTENVATIMINKLRRFDGPSQTVMKVASCLGSSFSTSTVALIVGALPVEETGFISDEDKCDVICDDLEEEGILEMEGSESMRFVHDQIQASAYQLIKEPNSFCGEIGNILLQKMDPESLEENLFLAVSLRNSAVSTVSGEDRRDLARLNLRVGLMASQNAAFDAAVVFYSTGRALLGENAWNTDLNTMLKLCSEEANAHFINGDLMAMTTLIDEVLCKDLSVEEKFRVYEVKVLAAAAASKFDEAINTIIEVRKQLKLSTPRNEPASILTVIKEFIKTNHFLKGYTPEKLLASQS